MKGISSLTATVVLIGVSLTIAVLIGLWMSGIVSTTTSYEKLEVVSAYVEKAVISTNYSGIDQDFPQHICVVEKINHLKISKNSNYYYYYFYCSPTYIYSSKPYEKFKLAEIRTPQEEDEETLSKIKELIEGKTVFLDIDDNNTVYKNQYINAVVYVRYNETHLLNINKYLVINNYAEPIDQGGEFNSSEWSLFIYYPSKYYDNIERNDAFIVNADINVKYIKRYSYGLSYTRINRSALALAFDTKDPLLDPNLKKYYLRIYVFVTPSKVIRAVTTDEDKVFKHMISIASNGTHLLVAWTHKGNYGGYKYPIRYRIYSLSKMNNVGYIDYTYEGLIEKNNACAPSVLFLHSKWIIIYGTSTYNESDNQYNYSIVIRMINPTDPENYIEYNYTISSYQGIDPGEANKVGYLYIRNPIVYKNKIYLVIRYYDKITGYNIGVLEFDSSNHVFKLIPVDEHPGDQGNDPNTFGDYASCFDIYNNTYASDIVNNKLLILYSNTSDGDYGYSRLYYALVDIGNEKVLKKGVITEVDTAGHRFFPRISNSNEDFLITLRDKNWHYNVSFVDINKMSVTYQFSFIAYPKKYVDINRVRPMYISSDKLFTILFTASVKNTTNGLYYEDIYLATIDSKSLKYNNGLTGAVLADTDDELGFPVYMNDKLVSIINIRIEYDSSGNITNKYIMVTTVDPYVKIPITLRELMEIISNGYEVVVIIRNTGTVTSSIENVFLDGRTYRDYGEKVVIKPSLPISIPPGKQVEIRILLRRESPFVPGKTVSIAFTSSRGSRLYRMINLP